MKKLAATDFDGTFMRNGVISGTDRTAVEKWRAAGNYFGFVTGRGTDFFDKTKELGICYDFLILFNGAMLALPDKTVIKEYLIPANTFSRLHGLISSLPDAIGPSAPDGREFYHQYYVRFDTVDRAVEVADEINRLFADDLNAVVNGGFVNVGEKGSSKAKGVFDALEYFSLPDGSAAVFGDDLNDIDMIIKHNGWAVANARPEVLRAAPHVCESVGEFLIRELNTAG